MLRSVLRACLLAWLVAAFLGGARAPRDAPGLRRTAVRASRYARRAVRVLGLRLRRESARIRRDPGGALLVCNHLSWLDPLLLAAVRPAIFVTSMETAEDSFLGRVCAGAGCVFMERRRRGGLRGECARLAALLRGMDVVVFPEATSSDGTRLLPFRPACFGAAIDAPAPVQPAAVAYTALDGRPIRTPRARDCVCWYGDMVFLPHLLGLLPLRRIDARVRFLTPLHPGPGACRKRLAQQAHAAVAAALPGLARAVRPTPTRRAMRAA